MALRWIEGFEARQNATYYTRLYAQFEGTFSGFVAGRRTGSSIRGTSGFIRTNPLVPSVSNIWTVGFGQRVETINSTNYPLVALNSGATEQVRVEMQSSVTTPGMMNALIKRGATTLATSVDLLMERWHYFELQVTVRIGTDGAYELKMDGATILSASGVNTANTGVDGADGASFYCGGGATVSLYDDIYILDDTGMVNNDFLDQQIVLGILPNGDGASLDWVPSTGSSHFAMIDDSVASVSDDDDVSSNVDGDVDLYDFTDLSTLAAAATINGVALTADMRMRSSGAREVNVRFHSGGMDGDFDSYEVSSRSFVSKMSILDEDPVAVGAWTKTNLVAGQFGLVNVAEVP